jgi:hypothetical protein
MVLSLFPGQGKQQQRRRGGGDDRIFFWLCIMICLAYKPNKTYMVSWFRFFAVSLCMESLGSSPKLHQFHITL